MLLAPSPIVVRTAGRDLLVDAKLPISGILMPIPGMLNRCFGRGWDMPLLAREAAYATGRRSTFTSPMVWFAIHRSYCIC